MTGVLGVIGGIAPHVLHHVGPLVGAAFLAGAGGTVLFAVVGFVLSIPMLVRLKRRFASWWAPAIATAIFALMFTVSTLFLGPLISGIGSGPPDPGPAPASTPAGHDSHH